jgi:osmotically-inducible protein OsmY
MPAAGGLIWAGKATCHSETHLEETIMAMDWDERPGHGRDNRRNDERRYESRGDRQSGRDRDWSDRAGDEMRSWLGDDDAERRRSQDQGRDERGSRGHFGGGGYGQNAGGYEGRMRPFSGREAYQGNDRSWQNEQSSSSSRDSYGYPQRRSDETWGPRYGSGRGSYSSRGDDYGRNHDDDRGFFEKAGDEVASWFGDEDAQARREMDARHRGRGPKNYTRSDERIAEDVNDRLSDDPHIDATGIDVSVSAGEVTLNGTVTERFAKRHAEDIAERVSGVKHVQNNLRVVPQATTSDSSGSMTTGASGRSTTGSTLGDTSRH